MSAIATYMRFAPLYEAMTVCTQTLEEIKRQEVEREELRLLEGMLASVRNTQKFIKLASSEKDILADTDKEQIKNIVSCVSILMAMMQCLSRQTRKFLPNIVSNYRDAISATLDDADKAIEEVEDILEAWAVCADEELLSKISEALKEIDPRKTEIVDWRKALEQVPD